MKNVLLVGDSIRLGYQGRVKELLGDDVQIFSPGENCRYTKFTLWGMFSWNAGMGNPHISCCSLEYRNMGFAPLYCGRRNFYAARRIS